MKSLTLFLPVLVKLRSEYFSKVAKLSAISLLLNRSANFSGIVSNGLSSALSRVMVSFPSAVSPLYMLIAEESLSVSDSSSESAAGAFFRIVW